MLGTLVINPGTVTGMIELEARTPALPKDAPSPGSSRSTRTTSRPWRKSLSAVETPTMPAPMTATVPLVDSAEVMILSCPLRVRPSRRFRTAQMLGARVH